VCVCVCVCVSCVQVGTLSCIWPCVSVFIFYGSSIDAHASPKVSKCQTLVFAHPHDPIGYEMITPTVI